MNQLASKLFSMRPEELHGCYARIFESPEGQIVLEDLKQTCFHYAPENGKDPYETYSNIGKRAVLLHILTRLEPIKAKENK